MSALILHGVPVSGYTAKVRIALCVKQLEFEERQPPGGYRSEAWRGRVPTGTIPALEVDGTLLAESEAILEYLEEVCPTPSLLPGNPLQRAHARFLARFHDLHLEPRVRALFPIVRDANRTRDQIAAARAAVQERLDLLSRLTQPAPYLAGTGLSVADCGMVVTCQLARRLLAPDVLADPLVFTPAIAGWLAQLSGEAAFERALAPWRA
jgi:glutathione S-transferase